MSNFENKIKNIKIAFFDLDGVLSIPRYKNSDGIITCGMLDTDWFDRCQNEDDIYKYCIPPKQIINLLQKLKNNNTLLFVLTHETNSGAYFNKVDYVLKNYKDYFTDYRHVLFVNKTENKIKLIKSYAKKYKLTLDQCLLIEDTYDTCLLATNNNIKAMHISELFLE